MSHYRYVWSPAEVQAKTEDCQLGLRKCIRPLVESATILVRIKLLHTAIWLFFVGCIVAIPFAAVRHQSSWAAARLCQ